MAIKILYFASLRERLNRSEDIIPFQQGLTVNEVWSVANEDLALPPNVLTSINQEYATFNSIVEDFDEVAFFPPVTGG